MTHTSAVSPFGKERKWHIYYGNPSLPFQIFWWRESHHRLIRCFNRHLLKVEEQFLDHVFYSLQEQTSQAWWVHCFSVRSWQICDAVNMLRKHNSLPQVKCRRKKKIKRMKFYLDLTSISSFFPLLTISILHSSAPGTICLNTQCGSLFNSLGRSTVWGQRLWI